MSADDINESNRVYSLRFAVIVKRRELTARMQPIQQKNRDLPTKPCRKEKER
jgi:hypothetical protein